MIVTLDTDKLSIAQLYSLSWLVFDQPEVYKAIVKEHKARECATQPKLNQERSKL